MSAQGTSWWKDGKKNPPKKIEQNIPDWAVKLIHSLSEEVNRLREENTKLKTSKPQNR